MCGNGARKRNNNQGRPVKLGPPEFVPTLSIGKTFRFETLTGAVTALPVTRAMLLNLYTMATTTTIQNRIITAVKLKRVRVWGQPPVLGAAGSTVVVEWVGTQAPSTIHSDTSMGVRPSFVDTRPPADSSDKWWSISGSNESEVLFNITAPIGAVVDVSLSLRLADDEAAVQGEDGTAAGSIAGRVYFNYLDGFVSKMLTPVGGVRVLP